MVKFSSTNWILLLLYSIGLFFINYFADQSQFFWTILNYTIVFSIYIYFIRIRSTLSGRSLDALAILFHLIPLFAIPSLSPDVYRFIWDGELLTHGIHPYAYTPQEIIVNPLLYSNDYLNSIYGNLSDISKSNYSVYPTINQLYFVIPSLITENVYLAVVVMKILVLGTSVLGYIYLKKILNVLKLSSKNAWILAINPFVIIETTGNLHFEGVMLSFLFIAFYFILTKKWVLSALFWALAINVKLTPLVLLPFLLRFIGWKKAFIYYTVTGVLSFAILGIYLWPSMAPNFMQSIELYFNNFQFNSSIFALTESLFYTVYDYETILIIGPFLSKVSLVIIGLLAIYKPITTESNWFQRMLFGYVIYLLFATTVHPWYIVLPFGLSVFSKNTFMIGWTFVIMLSYGFYAVESHFVSVGLIIVEYIVLLFLLFIDLYYKRKQHFLQRLLKL